MKRNTIIRIVLIVLLLFALMYCIINCSVGNIVNWADSVGESASVESASTEEKAMPAHILAPIFSLDEFFYDSDMTLELTYTDKYGAYQIYYTTDGTIPNEDSELYTDPIEILSTRKTVSYPYKARALHEDGSWSEVTHHTYFFGMFVKLDRFNTLVISLSTDPYNLYDYEYGILIEGKLRDEWRAQNPKADVSPPMPANYNIRGRQSERPIYIEMFTKDGERVISQNGGVRVYGGWSRANNQKSLKLYARKEYDVVNWFNYQLFGTDYSVDDTVITRYKRFVVRNAGNDHGSAYIRDELFHTLARDAGFPDTERVTPVSVFMNGEYFGFYWLHDVYCDEYFQERYGKFGGYFTVLGIGETSKQANEDDEEEIDAVRDYHRMYRYCSKDLTQDDIYAELCELLDVENYMMYCAINTYIDNNDWPHNNNRSYRYYAADGQGYSDVFPFDGKWRYMMHDSDYSSGIYGLSHTTNTIRNILRKDKSPMLMALMEREDCKEFFVKYMLDLLNGAFAEDNFVTRLNKMHASRTVEMDMFVSTCKYAPNISMSSVSSSVRVLKEFAQNRPAAMINNLHTTFGLNSPYDIIITNDSNCGVMINTYATYDSEFTGTYISDYATTIKAVVTDDMEFSHWTINGEIAYDEIIEVQEASEIVLYVS